MKRNAAAIISLILCICTMMNIVLPASAETQENFSMRNGITFEDTIEVVMEKEVLDSDGSNEAVDTPWVRYRGTIVEIPGSLVTYWYDKATGKLCDVKFTFADASIKDSATLNKYYETIYASIVRKYGEPTGVCSDPKGPVSGKAYSDYTELKGIFEMMGGKFTTHHEPEWFLEYDNCSVKIDIVAYSMQGTVYTLVMGYRVFDRAEDSANYASIVSDL